MSRQQEQGTASRIFVLCTPRSGSSLVRYIIDAHPRICCPAELSLGPLAKYLYEAAYYSLAQVRATGEEERQAVAVAEVRRVLDDLMRSYARLKRKEIWCEKTPKNLQHVKLLEEAFPDAFYICLYRNCMDMVHSSVEGSRFGKMDELWDYARIYEAWIEQTGEILKFEREHPQKCFGVKYESLVLNPAGTLAGLFAFLGVEWDERLIERVFATPHDLGPGDPKVAFSNRIYQNAIGKGSSIKREEVPRPLLEKINALLRELDYPEVGADWNDAPSPYLPTGVSPDKGGQLSNVGEVLDTYIPRRLGKDEELLRGLSGTLKLVVKGEDGGVWKVDLNQRPARVTAEDSRADCTITVVSGDLVKIANGELNAGECFLQAKLKVTGDELFAYKVGQVLFGG